MTGDRELTEDTDRKSPDLLTDPEQRNFAEQVRGLVGAEGPQPRHFVDRASGSDVYLWNFRRTASQVVYTVDRPELRMTAVQIDGSVAETYARIFLERPGQLCRVDFPEELGRPRRDDVATAIRLLDHPEQFEEIAQSEG